MTTVLTLATATVALSLATAACAANPMVGGAPMFETKNIVENAVNSADHTTLVATVQAAGLVDTLQGPGPFGQGIGRRIDAAEERARQKEEAEKKHI